MRKPRPASSPPAPRAPSRLPTDASRRLPPDKRREALLEAALPIFARLGWAGAGTRELSRAAGVSEPILYRHFADKEGLFLAVLERAEGRVAEVLARRARGARGAARLQALADGLDEILDERLSELQVLAAAGTVAGSPAVTTAARRHLAALGDLLGDLLKGAGLRRGVDPAVAGGLLLELGLGAAVLVPLGVPLLARERFRAPALRLVARAFTA